MSLISVLEQADINASMDVNSGEVIFRVVLTSLTPAQKQRLIANRDLFLDLSLADVQERIRLLEQRVKERQAKGQPYLRLDAEQAHLEDLVPYLSGSPSDTE